MRGLYLLILSGLPIVFAMSCGNKEVALKQNVTQEVNQINEGEYFAKLTPLNQNVAGYSNGLAQISIGENKISVSINMIGVPVGVNHSQYVRVGERCPEMSDDRNGDQLIDTYEESVSLTGSLIPLDGDLNSQKLESLSFPLSNRASFYFYNQSASLQDMMSDLYKDNADSDGESEFLKLKSNTPLNLAGKFITIHGISASQELPDSFIAINSEAKQRKIIIACGKIIRGSLENMP